MFLSPAVFFVIARSVATRQSSTPVYGWCYDFIINTCSYVEDHHVGLKSSSWWQKRNFAFRQNRDDSSFLSGKVVLIPRRLMFLFHSHLEGLSEKRNPRQDLLKAWRGCVFAPCITTYSTPVTWDLYTHSLRSGFKMTMIVFRQSCSYPPPGFVNRKSFGTNRSLFLKIDPKMNASVLNATDASTFARPLPQFGEYARA